MIRILVLTSALALTACAGGQPMPAPVTPTPAEIAAEAQAISAVGISPADYVTVGGELITRQCSGYFDAATMAADQRAYAQQQIGLGGAVASGLIGIAGASGGAAAIPGLLAGAVSNAVGNQAILSAAGPFPDETGTLVESALQAYTAAAPQPQTAYDAALLVAYMARICSYHQIHSLQRQAISTARVIANAPVSNPTPIGARFAPARMVPPIISVQH